MGSRSKCVARQRKGDIGKTMIEIKVKAVVDRANLNGAEIDIENNTDGATIEVMHESLAIIQSLSDTLKKNNPIAHLLFVKEVVGDPEILFGKDFDPNERKDALGEMAEKTLADMMSKAIIQKGVN